jgi:hypothetical protein
MAASLALAVASAGCESSQAKSRQLAKHAKGLLNQKGLTVTRQNADVKVVDAAVLHDANGTAVVVRMRSRAGAAQVDVPIGIDVTDAKGSSLFKNDAGGLEHSLVARSVVPAGGEVLWVNDQVTASGAPAKVSAAIGPSKSTFEGPLPKLVVSNVHLTPEPHGVAARAVIENRSTVAQRNVLVFAIARAGGKIVAAGRAIVPKLPAGPKAKPVHLTVFFIGDPRRGTLQLEAAPTTLR